MNYQKFRPADSLSAFVECYFVWESKGLLREELVVESPPNGFCSIVFNYGGSYWLQNKKYNRLAVPPVFIAGQSIYSYKLFLQDRIGIAGIAFKPAALATVFGLDAFAFTEERVDLFSALPMPNVREYAQRILTVETPSEKAKAMEEFLLHYIKRNPPTPDYIDQAVDAILQTNGMLHVQDLLQESCMSRRTFERHFFQKVGLSPKYYARIRRIGYICSLIAGRKKVAWPDVFYEAQYYDQAHFIKDFEAFTGRSPQQYLQENKELANLVERPHTQALP